MIKHKVKRHFEQIPLEKLEKDLQKEFDKIGGKAKSSNVVFETPKKKTKPYSIGPVTSNA